MLLDGMMRSRFLACLVRSLSASNSVFRMQLVEIRCNLCWCVVGKPILLMIALYRKGGEHF